LLPTAKLPSVDHISRDFFVTIGMVTKSPYKNPHFQICQIRAFPVRVNVGISDLLP